MHINSIAIKVSADTSQEKVQNTFLNEKLGSPYLTTTFNIGSYLHIVPFQIEFDENEGVEVIKPVHFIRKVICGIIHCYILWQTGFALLRSFLNVTSSLITTEGMAASLMKSFWLIGQFGVLIMVPVFLFTLWMEQPRIQRCIQETSMPYQNIKKHQLICAVYYFFNVFIIGYTYFVILKGNGDCELNLLLRVWDGYCHCVTRTIYQILLSVSITVHNLATKFCNELKVTPDRKEVEKGLNSFRKMKGIFQEIDYLFGTSLLGFYVITISYYGMFPDKSIWMSYLRIVANFGYLTVAVCIFVVSAQVHLKIQRGVQNWISSVQKLQDLKGSLRLELTVAYNENLMDPVGISCRFFKVTYGFLGNSFSLILTYGIVIFQVLMSKS